MWHGRSDMATMVAVTNWSGSLPNGILKPARWLRGKIPMSSFKHIVREGFDINVAPTGWRRLWGCRWFPYFEGNDVSLRIDVKRLSEAAGLTSFQIKVENRDGKPVDDYTPVIPINWKSSETRAIFVCKLRHGMMQDGKFHCKLVFGYKTPPDDPHSFLAATLDVRSHLTILVGIWTLITAGVTWGLAHLKG
jgi:hypothetical protein